MFCIGFCERIQGRLSYLDDSPFLLLTILSTRLIKLFAKSLSKNTLLVSKQ